MKNMALIFSLLLSASVHAQEAHLSNDQKAILRSQSGSTVGPILVCNMVKIQTDSGAEKLLGQIATNPNFGGLKNTTKTLRSGEATASLNFINIDNNTLAMRLDIANSLDGSSTYQIGKIQRNNYPTAQSAELLTVGLSSSSNASNAPYTFEVRCHGSTGYMSDN